MTFPEKSLPPLPTRFPGVKRRQRQAVAALTGLGSHSQSKTTTSSKDICKDATIEMLKHRVVELEQELSKEIGSTQQDQSCIIAMLREENKSLRANIVAERTQVVSIIETISTSFRKYQELINIPRFSRASEATQEAAIGEIRIYGNLDWIDEPNQVLGDEVDQVVNRSESEYSTDFF